MGVPQDATEEDASSDQAGDRSVQLVWALHTLVDTNKANQHLLQAAGGLHFLVHLLAKASPPSQAYPTPAPLSGPSPTSGMDSPKATRSLDQIEPGSSSGPLHTSRPYAGCSEQPQLATALLWLMGSAAADAASNQSQLHHAGAVQLLLHQMRWSRVPGVVQDSMWALGHLVKGCTDIQSEVQLQVRLRLHSAHIQPLLLCAFSHLNYPWT